MRRRVVLLLQTAGCLDSQLAPTRGRLRRPSFAGAVSLLTTVDMKDADWTKSTALNEKHESAVTELIRTCGHAYGVSTHMWTNGEAAALPQEAATAGSVQPLAQQLEGGSPTGLPGAGEGPLAQGSGAVAQHPDIQQLQDELQQANTYQAECLAQLQTCQEMLRTSQADADMWKQRAFAARELVKLMCRESVETDQDLIQLLNHRVSQQEWRHTYVTDQLDEEWGMTTGTSVGDDDGLGDAARCSGGGRYVHEWKLELVAVPALQLVKGCARDKSLTWNVPAEDTGRNDRPSVYVCRFHRSSMGEDAGLTSHQQEGFPSRRTWAGWQPVV